MWYLLNFGLIFFGFLTAARSITQRFLLFYQQEEYDSKRFLRWWIRSRSFERRATIAGLIFSIAPSVVFWMNFGLLLLIAPFFSEIYLPLGIVNLFYILVTGLGSFALVHYGRKNQTYEAKKPLVMTQRAKRIYILSLVNLCLVFGILTWLAGQIILYVEFISIIFLTTSFLFQLIPLSLTAANGMLSPVESFVQKKYLREAQQKLEHLKPTIIGITGSYGKTSTKHILAHILAYHAPTLATPGSVNTRMGITRVIREQLQKDCRFFLVEMGAYGPGSIRRLCRLTPPHLAIVTAVGIAHLERFKTIETVALAKAELPQALPPDGIAILNGDSPYCRSMANDLQVKTFFYGSNSESGTLHCRLLSAITIPQGTRCKIQYGEKEYELDLPLFGRHQAINAAGAFLAANQLGVPPITAVAALKTVPAISHRLAVSQTKAGITIIDDSYNSNPDGFIYALEVLRDLPGEQKILITPGMVELGEQEQESHIRVADLAAQVCDQIALVAPQRIPEFQSALLSKGFPKHKLFEFPSLQKAREWVNEQIRTGTVILYENDLPDLYETPSAFS